MVEYQLPKLTTRVRFPSSAPKRGEGAYAPSPLFGQTPFVIDPPHLLANASTPAIPGSYPFFAAGRELAGSAARGASIPAEERVKLACKRQGAKYS